MRTKTSQIGRSARRGEETGFTLFELLVVMVIATLATGAVSVMLWSGPGRSGLKSAAYETAARLREARATAINQGRSNVVLVDLERRIITTKIGRIPVEIADGIQVTMTAAAGERQSKHIAGVRFYPNGSSTGATLKFALNDQAFEVRVYWLTGRVAIAPVR